jgi:diaminohydroxyphosphoribosylaminopyrimidine deaminase/5-amino-6-(5-phosphoribosylamino)uracil reductase
LKWAESGNKKIAGNQGRVKISNEVTDTMVHKWRSEESAILVGYNTALHDILLLQPGWYPDIILLEL